MKRLKRKSNPNRDKTKDYVNGPTLQAHIERWYEMDSDDPEKIPPEIIISLLQIIDRLGTKGNFRGYSYLEEMKGDAIEVCFKAIIGKKYKTKFKNPFAYFTTIAYNAFVNYLNIEAKETYVKNISLIDHSQQEILSGNDRSYDTIKEYIDNDIIEKFNKKKKKKETIDEE